MYILIKPYESTLNNRQLILHLTNLQVLRKKLNGASMVVMSNLKIKNNAQAVYQI